MPIARALIWYVPLGPIMHYNWVISSSEHRDVPGEIDDFQPKICSLRPKCLICHQLVFLHMTCDAGTYLMHFALSNLVTRIQRGAVIQVYPIEKGSPKHQFRG